MKEFFKSTAFKSVAVLLVICIVCVGLLGVLNDVMHVTSEERFNRAMSKVYPGMDRFEKESSIDPAYADYPDVGTIQSVAWAVKGSTRVAAVVEAKGVGGFNGGTVTSYVVIGLEGDEKGLILGWAIKETAGQTYMNKFSSSIYTTWYQGADVADELGIPMGSNAVTGATRTSNAINNSVNAAAYYARNALGLGEAPPEVDLGPLGNLIAGTQFEDVEFANSSKTTFSWLSVSDNLYAVNEGDLNGDTVYVLLFNTTRTDSEGNAEYDYFVYNSSLDDAKRMDFRKSDDVTDDVANEIVNRIAPTNTYVTVTKIEKSGATYTYTVSSKGYGEAPSMNLTIVIDGTGIVSITASGPLIVEHDTNPDLSKFTGAKLGSDGQSLDKSVTTSGATHSSVVLTRAAVIAVQHYAANNNA